MTVTQFGWCPKCEERVELVPVDGGVLACYKCDNLDVKDEIPD